MLVIHRTNKMWVEKQKRKIRSMNMKREKRGSNRKQKEEEKKKRNPKPTQTDGHQFIPPTFPNFVRLAGRNEWIFERSHYLLTFSKLTHRHIVIRNKIQRERGRKEEKENDTERKKCTQTHIHSTNILGKGAGKKEASNEFYQYLSAQCRQEKQLNDIKMDNCLCI